MVGNEIYDPCFANPDRSRVACAEDVLARTVTVIAVTRKLPPRTTSASAAPWALRLANGVACQILTGATGLVDGMRLNYACRSRSWILGNIDRSQEPWRVYYSPKFDGSHAKRIPIAEAVY